MRDSYESSGVNRGLFQQRYSARLLRYFSANLEVLRKIFMNKLVDKRKFVIFSRENLSSVFFKIRYPPIL